MTRKLLILLLIAASALHAVIIKENRRNVRIRVATFSAEQTNGVANYAADCSGMVDRLLAIEAMPAEYIDIHESNSVLELPEDTERKMYFNTSTEMHDFTYRLMRKLVRRRVRELFGKNNPNGELADFLAAALTFRRIMDLHSLSGGYDWDYVPARTMFASGKFPNAEMLLSKPIPTSFQYLFQLNAMYCDLMLYSLERFPGRRGEFVMRLMENDSKGGAPKETVRTVIIQSLPEGTTLQGWFEKHARLACRRERSSRMNKSIPARVKALESFSILNATKDHSVETVTLDDLPAAFMELKIDKSLLVRREAQFLELANECSPIVRPALEMYAHAIGGLTSGDARQFYDDLHKAREALAKALERQNEIAAIVSEAEKEFVPVTERYRPFIDIMSRFRRLEEEVIPIPKN